MLILIAHLYNIYDTYNNNNNNIIAECSLNSNIYVIFINKPRHNQISYKYNMKQADHIYKYIFDDVDDT
jgi:hypothetical protein